MLRRGSWDIPCAGHFPWHRRLTWTAQRDGDGPRCFAISSTRRSPARPLANPVIAKPLQNSLLGWLLQAIDHPYREALDGSVRSWGPRTVRRGVDTIEALPQWPLTTAGLAADAGMNVRVLQQCWRRHRDVTPMSYLRGVRLACAHRDLEEHAPGETTVSATAFNWGLARPARFTTRYTRRYGLPPHQTLRGAAYA